MHSRIYQVSIQPIEVDDYSSPSQYYNNSNDFADYIGDEMKGDTRKDDIKALAEDLSDLFDLDESCDALVYNGRLDDFKEGWVSAIQEKANEITVGNVLSSERNKIRILCKDTHLNIGCRFDIKDWCDGLAEPLSELIEYMEYAHLRKGKKFYIGAVIDFHY